MKKLLRLTLLALLLGTAVAPTTAAQFDGPPPICDPTEKDCKINPPGLS